MARNRFPSVRRLIPGSAFLMVGLICFGCGLKAPPVPPRQPPIPKVVELAYRVADSVVTLTWRLRETLAGRPTNQAAFGIYRSRTAVSEPACEGCPRIFQKVATVPYVHSDANRFSVDVPLEAGYRYVFKVRLELQSGAGPDSAAVQFTYLPGEPSTGPETP